MVNRITLGVVSLVLLCELNGPAFGQRSFVNEYGEVAGQDGRAEAIITVAEGDFVTLIATAQISGATLAGSGVLIRAGVGVDMYVDNQTCAADRDIRRYVDVAAFQGKFASSATCLTTLLPGTHVILAESISVNVTDGVLEMDYSVLPGRPEKLKVPAK